MVSLCIDPFSLQAGQVKTESAVLANRNCYFWTTHTHLVDLQEYTNQVTTSTANGVTYALLQQYSWLLQIINTVLTKKKTEGHLQKRNIGGVWNIELLHNYTTHPLDAANDLPHQLAWWWHHPVRWPSVLMCELQ